VDEETVRRKVRLFSSETGRRQIDARVGTASGVPRHQASTVGGPGSNGRATKTVGKLFALSKRSFVKVVFLGGPRSGWSGPIASVCAGRRGGCARRRSVVRWRRPPKAGTSNLWISVVQDRRQSSAIDLCHGWGVRPRWRPRRLSVLAGFRLQNLRRPTRESAPYTRRQKCVRTLGGMTSAYSGLAATRLFAVSSSDRTEPVPPFQQWIFHAPYRAFVGWD